MSHTGLGRALLALARCALLGAGEASAEDLLSYLRAPGVLANIDALDALQATVRRRALRTAEQALCRVRSDAGGDRLAAGGRRPRR